MTLPSYPKYKASGLIWLGEVPESWALKRLGHYFDERRERASDTKFEPLSVTKYGIVPRLESAAKTQDGDNRKKVLAGDFVINSRSDRKGSSGLSPLDGSVSLICTVLISTGLHGPFIHHLFRSSLFQEEYYRWGKGIVADLWSTNFSDMKNIVLGVPSEAEQIQIARFLDHETARIDALIEEQQRLIELLKEKRQAVISHAVTKGLDPTVPMKDSGVEWLGEVPEHWEVKQLKHVVDPSTSITYGIVQAGPEFEGGIPYIRTSDMSGEALPISGYPLTSPEIDESYARSRVRPGDIVMSIRASVGRCLPVPDELKVANLTQGTAKISAGQGITRNFLLAFLNAEATQNYFDLMAKGATFKEITLDALRRTPVLLPPTGEQIKIDQFVARHAGLLNETCKQAIQSISLLQERRSALISAAVTGKIDVRGWQPPASSTPPELAQEAV
jgi:type I restriction enzyme S subunit